MLKEECFSIEWEYWALENAHVRQKTMLQENCVRGGAPVYCILVNIILRKVQTFSDHNVAPDSDGSQSPYQWVILKHLLEELRIFPCMDFFLIFDLCTCIDPFSSQFKPPAVIFSLRLKNQTSHVNTKVQKSPNMTGAFFNLRLNITTGGLNWDENGSI